MNFIYEKIVKMLDIIEKRIYGEPTYIKGLEYSECGYKTSPMPPRGMRWLPMPEKFEIGDEKAERHMWIRGKIQIPENLLGKSVVLCNLSSSTSSWGRTPQFIIYIDGAPAFAFDKNHTTVPLDSSVAEHDFIAYCYTGPNTFIYNLAFAVCEVYENTKNLFYDISVPQEMLGYGKDDTRDYAIVRDELNNALNLVDFTREGDEFDAEAKKATDYLKENLFEKYGGNDISCVCIGHTHIDVAWLWTFAQTREKAQRSFLIVVNLMKRYPEYKFMSSQAQLYKFVKEDMPDLYEEIKKLVKEGRWEVEGAMWVEADCNIPSGESLVRQILYGKKFFKDEFDVDCRVLWLPDAFGYSAALPQILKKSGVEWFVTSKISWNEANRMPNDYFNWKGIDGTAIPTYFLTAQDKKKDGSTGDYTTYNAILCPKQVSGAYARFRPKELSDEVMVTYGYGDGGGGPTEGMIERGRRMTGGLPDCPKVKFEFAGEFLSDLKKKTADKKIPEWSGELYLEYHRGTYTSQAKNKKNNRRSEFLYRNAEMYSVLGEKIFGAEYPQKALLAGWEKILLCQFHDVLPGSSIHEVYEDTNVIYDEIMKNGSAIVSSIRNAVAKNIKTYGGLLVFNPNSFDTSAEIMAEGEWRYVEKIPAMGWAVVPPAEKVVPLVGANKIENDYLYVEFDANMNICRIYDKTARRDVLKAGEIGNAIEAYEDYPRAYDAWEITNYYKEKKYLIDEVVSCERYECGERAGFTITRKFRNSVIKQTISLDGHTKNITFDTDIDWKDEHILLKAAFPINVNANTAIYDIQYGYVERPTHENTSWDEAKFEVCAHKYADISERGYGVSLINDCKYGHSASGSTLSLTLLKSATYPDPAADKCNHKFTYVLYPHAGDIATAKTAENAYLINNPLECVPLSRQDGKLPDRFSLVKTDSEGTFVEAFKKAENGDGVIVRLYDAVNSRGPRKLTFGLPVKEAYICDMLENELSQVETDGRNVVLDVKPFEIVTLKVKI